MSGDEPIPKHLLTVARLAMKWEADARTFPKDTDVGVFSATVLKLCRQELLDAFGIELTEV